MSNALDRIAAAPTTRVGPSSSGRRFSVEISLSGDRTKSWSGTRIDGSATARELGVSLDVYSLARMIASEHGSDPPIYQLCTGEVARDEASRRKKTVHELLVESTSASWRATRGYYGRQSGRWASTYRDPRASHIVVAQIALGESTMFARGAQRFWSPRVQDGGRQGGQSLRFDALGIIERWGAEGWEWVGEVGGIDPYRLMLMRKVGARARTADARAIVAGGRTGDSGPAPLVGGSRLAPTKHVATAGAVALAGAKVGGVI